jgi:sortase A
MPALNSMRRRQNTILAVGALTAAAVVIFFTTAVRALYYAPEPEMSPQDAAALVSSTTSATEVSTPSTITVFNKSIPTRLLIPEITVDANVYTVGLGKSGNMGVPPNYTGVGWYRYGQTPGEEGSAVIDGHVNNGFGLDAVFSKLGTLHPGSDIYVMRKDGTKLRFKVTKVESYALKDVPLQSIFNTKGGAYLNLITCDGVLDRKTITYDRRLVVYSSLVGESS